MTTTMAMFKILLSILTLTSTLTYTVFAHASSDFSTSFNTLLLNYQMVAIGDIHGSSAPTELLIDVLSDDNIFKKIDVIVTEFGNSQYQAQLDDYLLNVNTKTSLEDIEPLWQDSIYFMAWQYQHYRDFVSTLQSLNATSTHKIRIVLAEPAFSWETLTNDKWERLTKTRIENYKQTVKKVASENKKAVLLFGAMHTLKQPVNLKRDDHLSVFTPFVSSLSSIRIATIWTHFSDNAVNELSAPSLTLLDDTSELNKPLSDISPRFAGPLQKLSDVANAYYYSGPLNRHAPIATYVTKNKEWRNVMRERSALVNSRVANQIKALLAKFE